jgi:hypothetical protein
MICVKSLDAMTPDLKNSSFRLSSTQIEAMRAYISSLIFRIASVSPVAIASSNLGLNVDIRSYSCRVGNRTSTLIMPADFDSNGIIIVNSFARSVSRSAMDKSAISCFRLLLMVFLIRLERF